MNEMIEEVVIAMRLCRDNLPIPDNDADLEEHDYKIARAVIEAMRYPSEEMYKAAFNKLRLEHFEFYIAWQAAIDEALK